MRLYTISITAHVDDLESLSVRLEADLDVGHPVVQDTVMAVLPAHLRKVADDLESGETGGE